MTPPQSQKFMPAGKQSVQTILADLKAEQRRLTEAVTWTENVAAGIKAAGKQIAFTNVGPIEPDTREVGIAFSMVAGGLLQDVFTFTLVCVPTEAEMAAMRQEPALAGEATRLFNMQCWLKSHHTRVFETWLIDERPIWRGSDMETQVFLTKIVREWLGYWFTDPPLAIYRQRISLEINALGRKPLKAT